MSSRKALLTFLNAQRGVVLDVVRGLDEAAWHRSVVPSGWTPAGMVAHLGDAERHWNFVVTGSEVELPWDVGLPQREPGAGFVCDRPSVEVVAYYREQCARADAALRVTPLSARPLGQHGVPGAEEPQDVRAVLLHLIEETARHAGHLDIAGELLDGTTGLAPR